MKKALFQFVLPAVLFVGLCRPAVAQTVPEVVWTATNSLSYLSEIPVADVANDGSMVAVVQGPGYGGDILVFRMRDGALIRSIPNSGTAEQTEIDQIEFSPDGQYVATRGYSHSNGIYPMNLVVIRSVADGSVVSSISSLEDGGQHDRCRAMALSPNGSMIAVATHFDRVQFRRFPDFALIDTLPVQPRSSTNSISSILFSPDGSTLAVGYLFHGPVDLWRVSDRTLLRSLPGHVPDIQFTDMAFSPDGTYLATAVFGPNALIPPGIFIPGGAMQVWRVSDGALAWTHTNDLVYTSVDFSPDGKTLLVVAKRSYPNLRFVQVGTWREYYCYDLGGDDRVMDQALYASSGVYYALTRTLRLAVARPPLFITDVKRDDQTITFWWSGGTGLYQVQQTTNVVTGPWANVGGSTTNFTATITNAAAQFFRVQALPNP